VKDLLKQNPHNYAQKIKLSFVRSAAAYKIEKQTNFVQYTKKNPHPLNVTGDRYSKDSREIQPFPTI
jgi:hypothetical protein